MVKVSVIVPVYNTERYLEKCMESVLSQTLRELEVVCVDDGSTDRSGELLEAYAKKDPRILVLHKENGGLVSSRKAGLAKASGEYVGFVDSDDWVDPPFYARLYQEAKAHEAELVSSDYIQEGAYSSVSADAVDAGVYQKEGMDFLRDHAILELKKRDKGLSGSLCTKLFRKELLERILPRIPDEVTVSEDKLTSFTFLLECDTAVVLHEAYYHYVLHPASMFHKENTDYLLNLHRVYQYFRTLYAHPNFTEAMRLQAELYVVQFMIKGINSQMGFSFRNLFRIDPYWLKELPEGGRILLYGVGELGETYLKQLEADGSHAFAGFIDLHPEKYKGGPYQAVSPEMLREEEYDVIVITIKNEQAAEEAKNALLRFGIPAERLRWFPQEELFWKYADAMGLLARE